MPVVSAISPKESPESITRDDPRFFNMNDLAKVLGVRRSFIRRMKSQGFRMPLGRATVAMAHEFLENLENDGEPLR